MRTSRIYVDADLRSGIELTLDRETSHYLGTVLRLQSGTPVGLFNGRDGEYLATITTASKKQVTLQLGEQLRAQEDDALTLHLGLGLCRGERMDYAIQKATELGVSTLTPLLTEFSEVRFKQAARLENKLRHWRRIAVSACEQSGRLTLPLINEPTPLADWLSASTETLKLILDPQGEDALSETASPASIAVAIGPEGGFSEPEMGSARSSGFASLRLGPRILRAETAPVVALAILQKQFGDI